MMLHAGLWVGASRLVLSSS